MRGPEKQAIVIRSPEGLVVKEEELKLIRDRYPILGWPLIRGSVTFLDSMVRGVKALMYSADFYPEEAGAEEPSKFEQWLDKKLGNEKMEKLIIGFSVVIAVCFSLLLFMFIPTLVSGLVEHFTQSVLARNLADGILRVAIFLCYLDHFRGRALAAHGGKCPDPAQAPPTLRYQLLVCCNYCGDFGAQCAVCPLAHVQCICPHRRAAAGPAFCGGNYL